MGNKRFIADTHFGHKNMAESRNFKSVEEHDEHIIKCWNTVVSKRDVTVILGDITMEKGNYEILGRLNGIKHVVGGNHDMGQHLKNMLEYVEKFMGCYTKGGDIYTHIPIHTQEINRFRYNIHGHLHNEKIEGLYADKYICVSCEQVDYTPRTLEELIKL